MPLRELLLADPDIKEYLKREEIEDLFDYNYHLRQVDYIFRRAGLE